MDVLHHIRRHPGVSISFHGKLSSSQPFAFTVKIATQTVARMKLLDDLYSNSQGFLRTSLSTLSISPAMMRLHTQRTQMETRLELSSGRTSDTRGGNNQRIGAADIEERKGLRGWQPTRTFYPDRSCPCRLITHVGGFWCTASDGSETSKRRF